TPPSVTHSTSDRSLIAYHSTSPITDHSHATCLHYSRNPRNLHSFPTRRSSDLERPRDLDMLGSDAFGSYTRKIRHLLGPKGWLRSEEHTSELQSLRHLVCRLLLEKKKKHQTKL